MRNRAHIKLFLVWLITASAFQIRCTKPNGGLGMGFGTSSIEPDVIAMVGFDVGSYWVYQDSITGKIDSQVVVSAGGNTVIYNNSTNYAYYEMGYLYRSTYDSSYYSTGSSHAKNDTGYTFGNYAYIYLTNIKPNDTTKYKSYMRYPYRDTTLEKVTGTNIYCRNVTSLSSYTVNGKAFGNVLLRYYGGKVSGSLPSPSYKLYFCEYIGLIKKVDNVNHHVWNLLRYKTIMQNYP